MSTILINTPQGVAEVTIAGNTPTQEELDRLRQLAPPDDPVVGFDYSMVEEEVEEEPEKPDLPTEEIENASLRYQVGRMDDDEEKANLLTQMLGEGTFERIGEDTFVVDQEQVSPELRDKYGLKDTGKVYVDKPGLSWYDVVDFAGESGPPVAAAVGASLMATGFGILPGMAIVGGAAALAKAADEGIEYLQGLNRQSAGDVASSIAIEGALNAGFEVVGRGAAWGIGRLIKGPGPVVSAERISELTAKGMSVSKAKKDATEEALAQARQMIAGGARPTIQEVTGKSLAARALAINEKILPNPQVGRDNITFVRKTLKDLSEGRMTQKEAKGLLNAQAKAVASMVSQKLANPDEAYKLAKTHLDDIVKQELDAFENAFVPSRGVPNDYAEGAKLAARLFTTESNALYRLSRELIGDGANFSNKEIVKAIDQLKDANKFVDFDNSLFDLIRKESSLSLDQLSQIKQALRMSIGDPELVPVAAQAGISKIIQSVDEVLDARFTQLSKDLAKGYKERRHPAGTVIDGKKVGGRFYATPLTPGELDNLRRGLGEWKNANKFYSEGQEQFNNAAVNTIIKNANGQYFTSNIDVVKQIVQSGNAPKLRMYLNAVTPKGDALNRFAEPGTEQALATVQQLVGRGEYALANAELKATGLDKTVGLMNDWIEKLPVDDIYRKSHIQAYQESLESFRQLAAASQAGEAGVNLLRENVRNGLAKTWINGTKERAIDGRGLFSPGKFATSFKQLGDETQDLLFGKESASKMRGVMDDFYLVGVKQNELMASLPSIQNQSLRAQVEALEGTVLRNIDESKSAVLKSIRDGTVDNPQALVSGLLKEPSSYNRLRAVIGDEQLGAPGGVKDMVMNNLIRHSFKTPLDEASIQSGAWGKALKDAITSQNANGGLSNMIGVDSVKALEKLANDAVKISDVPIKGYGGIAAAPAALALFAGLANPATFVPTLGVLGGVLVFSRALRNRSVLKLLTSPRYRAAEYEKAIAAGAELPSLAAQKQMGSTTYALNRIGSIMASEASLIAGSGILGVPVSESAKEVTVLERPQQGVQPTTPHAPGLPPLPSTTSQEEALALYDPALGSGKNLLRQIEQEKLLGLRQ